jgi:DNA-binding LacI/PurR family transcriptional regulator
MAVERHKLEDLLKQLAGNLQNVAGELQKAAPQFGESPTTLADVARALGLSKMTVSRAISNHPGISPETRARILETARQMNYHPPQYRSGENRTPPVRSLFGVWDSGDRRSADNDQIDADIVREYSSSHEAD